MFKKLKEKKGFTLVELIVVLVILAILAALLIPALTGYIDKAKEKSITAETRQAVMAAQTLIDEEYANVTEGSNSITGLQTGDSDPFTATKIGKLAEVPAANIASVTVDAYGKVTQLVYKDTSAKKQCTYSKTSDSKGTYKVEDIKK